jgi:hypothetical protein
MTGSDDPGYAMLVLYADAFLHDYGRLLLPHAAQAVRACLDERLSQFERDVSIYSCIYDLEDLLGGFRGWWFRAWHPRDTRVVRGKLDDAVSLLERDADYSRVYLPLEREQEYWAAINHIQWAERLLQPLVPRVPFDPTIEPAIQAWLAELRRQSRC